MKKYYIPVIIILLHFQPSFSQTFQWVRNNSHPIQFNPDNAMYPSTTDASGNFIICTIQNFRLIYGSSYFGDVIIRKYNSSGSEILSKIITGKVVINGIETDAGNNIYIHGSFMDTLTIEPNNFLFNTGVGFNLNDFLIKFNSSGGFVWKKNITALYGEYSEVRTLKVKGNSLYTGIATIFQSWVKIYDLNGNETAGFTQNPVRELSAIDIDAQGNIFTAGSCQQGNILFSNTSLNCPYVYSLYFAKYNSSFANQWVNFVEDVTFQSPSLVVDGSGNAVAAGNLMDDYIFGQFHTLGPQWVFDLYVTKMNSAGTFQWVKEIPHSQTITGDAALGRITNLAVDNQNSLYFIGFQRGFINWGPFITTSIGNNDALILKCNASGDFIWGKTAGGGGTERVDAISLDNSGNIFISGNFGPSAMFDTILVTGSGQLNSFSARLSNPPLGIQPVGNNIPSSYSLSNYPNPFNPSTKIRFSIPIGTSRGLFVQIKIYDILGKEAALPVNEKLQPGTYEITFDASNLVSGIYFYSLIVDGNLIDSRKMILVK